MSAKRLQGKRLDTPEDHLRRWQVRVTVIRIIVDAFTLVNEWLHGSGPGPRIF
ncbi:hypothetical protein [Actinoallomurus rhizosphaericola]|uniref:hypothetical protein n=1 Tax=Actinoallomurus rhizosphaericola TaxID=2952536 RepID=UPI002091FEC1|nr:hypothetical protein [Actinoallomurus rhizosphaericola]MCO5995748.1 hypothetical protein [Actinoallomurus rhizosphaericola]